MEPLKIVMVLRHDLLYPYIDSRVYKEARFLQDVGHRVTVVCWHAPPHPYKGKEVRDGIDVVRVKENIPGPEASRLARAPHYIRHLQKMRDTIVGLKPDIIHSHDFDTLIEAVMAKRKAKVPLVYDSHDDFPLMVRDRYPTLARGSLFTENLIVGQVDHMITTSTPHTRRYRKYRPVRMVMNGTPLEWCDMKPDSEWRAQEMDGKHGLGGKRVVLYHGGIGVSNGIVEMLESAAIVCKKPGFEDVVFVALGDSDRLDDFKKLAREKNLGDSFRFLGTVPYSEIPQYIANSEICFSVKRPDYFKTTMPIKVFEAMALGVPVLANRGFFELERVVGGNDCGLLVGLEPSEIAEAIEKLLCDSGLRRKLGENGRAAIRREFNWEKQARGILEVYGKVLGRPEINSLSPKEKSGG